MTNTSFTVPGISCGHCVAAIKSELLELTGIKNVEGFPENKTIRVEWVSPASETQIREKLKEINYPAE